MVFFGLGCLYLTHSLTHSLSKPAALSLTNQVVRPCSHSKSCTLLCHASFLLSSLLSCLLLALPPAHPSDLSFKFGVLLNSSSSSLSLSSSSSFGLVKLRATLCCFSLFGGSLVFEMLLLVGGGDSLFGLVESTNDAQFVCGDRKTKGGQKPATLYHTKDKGGGCPPSHLRHGNGRRTVFLLLSKKDKDVFKKLEGTHTQTHATVHPVS